MIRRKETCSKHVSGILTRRREVPREGERSCCTSKILPKRFPHVSLSLSPPPPLLSSIPRFFRTPLPIIIDHRNAGSNSARRFTLAITRAASQFADNFLFRSSGTQSICHRVMRYRSKRANRSPTYRFSNEPPDRRQVLRSARTRVGSRANDHTRGSCDRKVFPGIFTRRLLGRGQDETPLRCHLG